MESHRNPTSLLRASAKERASEKGKHVAVFVQPFLPSSNAQWLPEVTSLHLIALLAFSSVFFHFPPFSQSLPQSREGVSQLKYVLGKEVSPIKMGI